MKTAKCKSFRYVMEGSFDAYSWQLIENKQRFISQIMTGREHFKAISGENVIYDVVDAYQFLLNKVMR